MLIRLLVMVVTGLFSVYFQHARKIRRSSCKCFLYINRTLVKSAYPCVKVFRIIPEFRILRLTSTESKPQNAEFRRP